MSKPTGPSEEDVRLAEKSAAEARETAKALAPYVEANRLNPMLLKRVLDQFAPGNLADEDGIYDQRWMSTSAFYNNTEDYVPPSSRLGYKNQLETTFPAKKVML